MRRAARGVDGDGLREDDVDGDDVAGCVGAVCCCAADGLNGWGSGVDDEGVVAGEGVAAGKGGECEGGVVADAVLDGGAVEGE